MISSTSGKGSGLRCDDVIADDPLNVTDAHSKAARLEANRWWDQAMSQRLADPRVGTHLVVMQRLHEDDLTGHLIQQGGYDHLYLPSEFEPERTCITTLGRGDRRSKPSELLFPELYTPEVISEAKIRLGSTGFAGQHQQNPVPAQGEMFKRHWWRFYSKNGGEAIGRPRHCNDLPSVRLPDAFDRII